MRLSYRKSNHVTFYDRSVKIIVSSAAQLYEKLYLKGSIQTNDPGHRKWRYSIAHTTSY